VPITLHGASIIHSQMAMRQAEESTAFLIIAGLSAKVRNRVPARERERR
jgi:hypothetical protein